MKTKLKTNCSIVRIVRLFDCGRVVRCAIAAALCAVGMAAFAAEPVAVQLWAGGPFWAPDNIGATKPEEYGILTNFNGAAQAVTDALGEGWRVPSKDEFNILIGETEIDDVEVCSNVWTTCNGVKGMRFFGTTSGYEDKSIFLPAAGGDYGDGARSSDGENGFYWSSAEEPDGAVFLVVGDGDAGIHINERKLLFSVRAVKNPPPALAVKNVTFCQRYPWNGLVDIGCDLTGAGKVKLAVTVLTNDVKFAEATTLSGETEIDLDQVGGVTNGVKLVWDAAKDLPVGFNAQNVKVKVTAEK